MKIAPSFSFVALVAATAVWNANPTLAENAFTPRRNWGTNLTDVGNPDRLLHDQANSLYFVGTSGSSSSLVAVGPSGTIVNTAPIGLVEGATGSIVTSMGGYFKGLTSLICIVTRDDVGNNYNYRIHMYNLSFNSFIELWSSGAGSITSVETPFVGNDGLRSGLPVFSSDGSVVYISFAVNARMGINRAFETDTGKLVWETEMSPDRLYNGFAAAPDGSALYGGVYDAFCGNAGESGMHAIDPATGDITTKWVAPTQCICPEGSSFICNNYWAQPIVDDSGNIYAVDEKLGAVKFDSSSLASGPVWQGDINLAGQPFFSPSLNDDQSRVYASSEREFGGYATTDGVADFIKAYPSSFQRAIPLWGESAVAPSGNGGVYTITGAATECHDATNGTLLWTTSASKQLVVVSDSEVVIIQGGSVVSLNTLTPPTMAPSISAIPTQAPTAQPTLSNIPTEKPSLSPVVAPTPSPTPAPTPAPTPPPVEAPTPSPVTSGARLQKQSAIVVVAATLALSRLF